MIPFKKFSICIIDTEWVRLHKSNNDEEQNLKVHTFVTIIKLLLIYSIHKCFREEFRWMSVCVYVYGIRNKINIQCAWDNDDEMMSCLKLVI